MFKRFFVIVALVGALLVAPVGAQANLIWDGDYLLDGPQDAAGTWQDGGDANWWNGTGDQAWSNASPAVAQFGSEIGTVNAKVNINSDLKVLGFVNYGSGYELTPTPFYDPRLPGDPPDGEQTIELNGTNPEIVIYATFWMDTHITTAAGVESVILKGGDVDHGGNLYFYNSNSFNAPIVVGSDPAVAKGITLMARIEGCLGGSSSDSITVMEGSTLRFGMPNDTITKPILVAGNSNAIEFYASASTPMCTRELTGTMTLTGDTQIRIRELDPEDENYVGPHSNIISGAISGDYVLSIRNSSSADPGRISLANGANTTKGLNVFSAHSNTYSQVYVTLGAQYTATESVMIGLQSTLITTGANYIHTPLISLGDATAILDASAAGLTLGNGTTLNTTLRGIGTVTGNVTAAAGSAVGAGTLAGTLAVNGTLDMSSGAGGYWGLGALLDNATGVAGTDFALMTVSGDMTLGVDSQLTLDFAEGFAPNASEVFWQSDHAWTIVDVADGSLLTGSFASITNPTQGGAGTFTTSVVDNNILLSFVAGAVLPPIPGDANNSGTVDVDDAKILAANWGAHGDEIGLAQGDFNGDKAVNAADASILAANWGATRSTEGAGSVPEPGSLLLLAAGAAFLAVWRRR